MYPTEAYLVAAIVAIVLTALAHAVWPELEQEERPIVAIVSVAAVGFVFLFTSELWWAVHAYHLGSP